MCHVLVIEDEWLIAEYITDIAERAGGTSFTTVETEDEAVVAADDRLLAIIIADTRLRRGTGPGAVRTIIAEHGELPVIFITASPHLCGSFSPRTKVLDKPINERRVIAAFRELAPL